MIWKYNPVYRVIQRDDGSNVMGLVPSRMATKDRLLVTAAPELLAACRDVVHDLNYVVSQPWSKRSEGDTAVLRNRLRAVECAIANATGTGEAVSNG